MNAIQASGLTRLYRNGRGIRGINLQVEQGEVFGFLGPNGAGKTTFIRTVMGFLRPTGGQIQVLGMDAVTNSKTLRHRIGFLPSDPSLYDFLTGRQNIEFALQVRGIKDRSRVKQLAERLDINLDQRLKSLSRGNKQKVAIIAALAHDPDLVILDEPTSGLDPLVQDIFQELIQEERARGKTVFMSSHVLSEVEHLCHRVGVIRDGEMVTISTVTDLKKQRVKHCTCEFAEMAPDLSRLPGVLEWQAEGRRARFTLSGDLNPLIGELAKWSVIDLVLSDPPLEEVFRRFYERGAAQ